MRYQKICKNVMIDFLKVDSKLILNLNMKIINQLKNFLNNLLNLMANIWKYQKEYLIVF